VSIKLHRSFANYTIPATKDEIRTAYRALEQRCQ